MESTESPQMALKEENGYMSEALLGSVSEHSSDHGEDHLSYDEDETEDESPNTKNHGTAAEYGEAVIKQEPLMDTENSEDEEGQGEDASDPTYTNPAVSDLVKPDISEDALFKCQVCGKEMSVAANQVIGSHLKICVCGSQFLCPLCQQKFSSSEAFDMHVVMHCMTEEGMAVSCEGCGKQYMRLHNPSEGGSQKPSRRRGRPPGKGKKKIASCKNKVAEGKKNLKSAKKNKTTTRSTSNNEITNLSSPNLRRRSTPRGMYAEELTEDEAGDTLDEDIMDIKRDTDKLTCDICDKSYTTATRLANHMRIHKKTTKNFKCDICGKTFTSSANLTSHFSTHDNHLQVDCMVCGKVFSRKESLKRHMRIHTGEKPYECEECGKYFRCSSDLSIHKVVHKAPSEALKCQECGKLFKRKDILRVHMRTHTGERPYSCEICGKSFYSNSHLREHKNVHNTKAEFGCPVCNKMFVRRSSVRKHMETHKYQKTYDCRECHKTFNSCTELKQHMSTHGDKTWQIACPICGNTFSRRDSLTVHMRLHTGERPFKCKLCPMEFYSSGKLNAHVKSHDPNYKKKPPVIINKECPICNKVLPTKNSFVSHMTLHTKERIHTCEICSKSFIDKHRLKIHQRIHTGEKPYTCKECGRKFTVSSGLKCHMKLHTGERPHSCKICGKGFIMPNRLKSHMRLHTGEKPFKCPLCDMMFRNKQNVTLHMRKHTGEKPHKCELCPKAFASPTQLHNHQTVHTGAREFSCHICGRLFTRAAAVRAHLKRIHKIVNETKYPPHVYHRKHPLPVPPITELVDDTDNKKSAAREEEDTDPLQDLSPPPSILPQGFSDDGGHEDEELPDVSTEKTLTNDHNPVTPPMAMLTYLHTELLNAVTVANSVMPGGATDDRSNHVLLSLTILGNFLNSANAEVLGFMDKNSVVDILVTLLENANKFIAKMAAKVLTQWIKICDNARPVTVVHGLVASLFAADRPSDTVKLDILTTIFSREKSTQVSPAGNMEDKKHAVFNLLLDQSQSLAVKFMSPCPNQSPDMTNTKTYSFLVLWGKLVKYFLTNRWKQLSPQDQGINQEADRVQMLSAHLLSLLEAGQVALSCVCRVLSAVSRCLPYGSRLSMDLKQVTAFHVILSKAVLQSFNTGCLLNYLPLVVGQELFGTVTYVRRGQELPEGSTVSNRALRSVMLLGLKSVAVTIAGITQGYQCLTSPIRSLHHLQNQLCALTNTTFDKSRPKLWMFDLCQDQDDVLVETLLCLLDIVLMAHNVTPQLASAGEDRKWLLVTFDPHELFVHFLATDAAWDESFLIDYIMAPETCFLTYFVKYLRYVVLDWGHFCNACCRIESCYRDDFSYDEIKDQSHVNHGNNSALLDRVMAVLIRLRMKVGRAGDKDLVGFNCEPLLRLIEKCEACYEQ